MLMFGICIPLQPVLAFLHTRFWEANALLAHDSVLVATDEGRVFGHDDWLNRKSVVKCWRLQTYLFMGKGDGKKKRKKKSSGGGGGGSENGSSAQSTQPTPLRVTSDSNIPVRRQIRWAKLNKEYKNQASAGFRQKRVVRSRYRRTWEEEELERKAEERRRKGQDPDWDVILNRTSTAPLVIVDGYNIIHKWARLKKHMTKGDLSRARQLLLDDLENLRVVKGWRIEVVFDGTQRSTVGPLGHGPGNSDRPSRIDQQSKASVSKYGVRVVFSGVGNEADTYIEARCAAAKNVTQGTLTGQFIVASDDSMIRIAGQSAGALCMSADRFITELKALKKAVAYRVQAAVDRVNGQTDHTKAQDRPVRFGRRSILIEDKRNGTKTKRNGATDDEELDLDLDFEIETDENGIPWWAQLPNTTAVRY